MGGVLSKAIAKVRRKLFHWKMKGKAHLLFQDFSTCMDELPQVRHVVYNNFTSMSNAIDTAFRNIDAGHIYYDDIIQIIQKVQQLNGVIRWALKWTETNSIDACFADILIEIECYFTEVSLLLNAASQPRASRTKQYNLFPEFNSLVKSIQIAHLKFGQDTEPPISMFSEESVMRRLDQAIEDGNIYEMHQEQCVFLKMFIMFIKEHTNDYTSWEYSEYICPWIEYVLDMMSCYVFHYKHRKPKYDDTDRINELIHDLILRILVRSSGSSLRFTDELLVAYVECMQKLVIWVPSKWNYQIRVLQDLLSLVHSLVSYTPKTNLDRVVFFHTKVYADIALKRLGHVIQSAFASETVGDKESFELYDWHFRIFPAVLLPILHCNGFLDDSILMKYASYFRHYWFQLPTNEGIDMKTSLEDQARFDEDLVFVAGLVFYQWSEHHVEREILLNARVEMVSVLRDLGTIIFSSFNNEVAGSIAMAMNPGLPHLVAKVEHIKIQLTRTISPKIFKRLTLHSPETNLQGFLDFFLENMKKRLCNIDFVGYWKDVLQTIVENIDFFRSFLQNMRDNRIKDDRLQSLYVRIGNAAYSAEYIFNAFAAGAFHVCCRSFIISGLLDELNVVKEIIVDGARDVWPRDLVPAIKSKNDAFLLSSRAPVPPIDVVVGSETQIKEIMERLASNQKKLDVISIVGMGGIGKTTLAMKVYEDPVTVHRFDIRAWYCVSQVYDKKHLLLSILGTDVTGQESSEYLSEMLYKKLMGRRYLIILDDVWDINVFDELKRFFPDNCESSRVILTGRVKLIGFQVQLQLLSAEESWKLLELKVFPSKKCPMELFQIGKEIARECGGLALAVVVVAGILAKSDMEQDVWKKVAKRLNIYNVDDSVGARRMKALDLSYELLPDHLKPLFLYVGAFSEKQHIPVKILKRLWISEGFITETKKKSLEMKAETYLMDLIDRNLLMVAERNSSGSVKSCNIHDLMHDMSLAKAKAENFMEQYHTEEIDQLSESLICPRRVSVGASPTYTSPKPSTSDEALLCPPVTYEQLSRLSIASRLNSLILYDPQNRDGRRDQFYKSIFQNHKILRVFHAHGWVIGSLFTHVTLPVNLRYISVDYYLSSRFPSSIFGLKNLETLIIKMQPGEKMEVPSEIWNMAKLRHLHIGDCAVFSVTSADSGKLENLQTLSTPVFFGRFGKLIERFPNLQKLKCKFTDEERWNFHRLPKLESLSKLEAVKMIWHFRSPCSAKFSLPVTLKKLSLSSFQLKWKDISTFQELPNLEILKLHDTAVLDESWEMGDEEFPKLVFFELSDLNIKRWFASDKNFPCLQSLVLRYCLDLKEIPSDLGYVCKKIEVISCSHSASNSAKRIQDEQRDGNPDLVVHISDPYPAAKADSVSEHSDSEYSDHE